MTLLRRAERRSGQYVNPVPTTVGGLDLLFRVVPAYLRNTAEREPRTPPGPFATDPTLYDEPSSSGLRVTWFGHSASLVELDGLRVLIDPVWELRASPLQSLGPKRFFPPTLALDHLPRIDVVLISHDHYDHLSASTVRSLSQLPAAAQARWVTPLGVGKWLQQFGVGAERIEELDWTQSVVLPTQLAKLDSGRPSPDSGLRITAWPARHFSGRWPWDRFRTLWASFVLEGPERATGRRRVFYGADSGPWPGFAEIGAHYPGFDLTMLEIGAASPFWPQVHLGPEKALAAYQALGSGKAGLLMPIHWGLFNLALHGWREPIETLERLATGEAIPLWSPRPGEPTEVVQEQPVLSNWWRAATDLSSII